MSTASRKLKMAPRVGAGGRVPPRCHSFSVILSGISDVEKIYLKQNKKEMQCKIYLKHLANGIMNKFSSMHGLFIKPWRKMAVLYVNSVLATQLKLSSLSYMELHLGFTF